MEILVYNTYIKITDYDLGTYPDLESSFQVWNKEYFRQDPFGMIYDKENRELRIYRSYSLKRLYAITKIKPRFINDDDPKDKVLEGVTIKTLPRDNVQKKAIAFLTSSGGYETLARSKVRLLSLPTGKGKTYCSIVGAVLRGYRTLIVAPSLELLKQWKGKIFEYCNNVHRNEVILVSGTPQLRRLLENGVAKYKFILISDMTLRSFITTYGLQKAEILFKMLRIGTKIFDEFHLHFEISCQIEYTSNTSSTFYLTATPARSNPRENKIYMGYFDRIPSLIEYDKESDPHTEYIAVKFRSNPTVSDRSKCSSKKYGLDRPNYIKYLTNNDNFKRVLDYIIDKTRGEKSLFFIGLIKCIDDVYDYICKNYPELKNDIGIYNSSKTEEEKKEALSKNIILTTIKSMGVGMDIPGLNNVAVLADPFKSEVTCVQTIGRCRGANTKYYDLIDISFKHTQYYYNYRRRIFRTYATEITEIDFDKL